MDLNNITNKTWNKSKDCDCGERDCYQNHKLCSLCGKTVIYGSHISNQPNSKYAWNIDHKNPESKGGSSSLDNLQLTCVPCNRNKGDK